MGRYGYLLLIGALVTFASPALSQLAAPTPNLNPDPLGDPWYVDGYTEPDVRPGLLPERRSDLVERLWSLTLSDRVDHSYSDYMRPVFVQDGGSCGSASRICYMFAYELNSFRDVMGSLPENTYPSHFTWLVSYQNSSKDQMARDNGVPNSIDYGGDTYSTIFGDASQDCFDEDYGWMTDYGRWYNAMFNRLDHNTFLDLDTPENLDLLKSWMDDHWGDSDFMEGGVAGAGCAITGVDIVEIPPGEYEAGKQIVQAWGPTIDHGTTWSGYDDDVGYDFSGDGQITNDVDITGDEVVDMADWERGALIMLNSWGSGWGNSGTVYVPYRLLKLDDMAAEFYRIRKDHVPEHVMKILMHYTKRSKIRISVGIAPDTLATRPVRTEPCHHFLFAGNGDVPLLGRWADGQMHSEPMEFGYDLTGLDFGIDTREPFTYFLQIETTSDADGRGAISSVSVVDYTGDPGGVEFDSQETNVTIAGTGDTTFVAVRMPGDPGSNPEHLYIPQSEMSVHYFDSQETTGEDGRAVNAIDGDLGTIWHTRWYFQTDPLPHEIQLDLAEIRPVTALQYLPRQNSANGRIAEYEIYVSIDAVAWGTPVATGIWGNTSAEQTVTFPAQEGRYVRLRALSEVNGNPWRNHTCFHF